MNDILRRKWDKGPSDPGEHKVTDCLEVALARVREGEFDYPPTHVIVVFGNISEDGCARTAFLQAGDLDAFAQVGLLDAAIALMRYNDRDE